MDFNKYTGDETGSSRCRKKGWWYSPIARQLARGDEDADGWIWQVTVPSTIYDTPTIVSTSSASPVAALAVVDAIADICSIVATIKWPNDVLIGNRKVAGILIETSHNHLGQLVATMGIGVNVNGRITQFMGTNAGDLQVGSYSYNPRGGNMTLR